MFLRHLLSRWRASFFRDTFARSKALFFPRTFAEVEALFFPSGAIALFPRHVREVELFFFPSGRSSFCQKSPHARPTATPPPGQTPAPRRRPVLWLRVPGRRPRAPRCLKRRGFFDGHAPQGQPRPTAHRPTLVPKRHLLRGERASFFFPRHLRRGRSSFFFRNLRRGRSSFFFQAARRFLPKRRRSTLFFSKHDLFVKTPPRSGRGLLGAAWGRGLAARVTSPPTPLPIGVHCCALVFLGSCIAWERGAGCVFGMFVRFGTRKDGTRHLTDHNTLHSTASPSPRACTNSVRTGHDLTARWGEGSRPRTGRRVRSRGLGVGRD